MALDIITWIWGNKFQPRDVVRLAKQVQKNLQAEHRFHVFTDSKHDFSNQIKVHQIVDRNLMDRSCFCRLRMFDPEWQAKHELSGTILSLDLDMLITGPLDRYCVGSEKFMILQDVNASNNCKFNGSVMRLEAGYRPDVWTDFSRKKVSAYPYHEFPDDQGWIWIKIPDAQGWKAGPTSGIYGFQKPGWPGAPAGGELPKDANIVAFIGRRKPHLYQHLPWVRKYWNDAG